MSPLQSPAGFITHIKSWRPVTFYNAIHTVISDGDLPVPLVNAIAISCVSAPSSEAGEAAQLREKLIRALQERHPAIVTPILKNRAMYVVQAGPAAEGVTGMDIDALIDDATPAFVQAVSADTANRERGVSRILSDTTLFEEDMASAKEILQRRLADNDVSVVQAVYAQPQHLARFLQATEILKIVRSVIRQPEVHRDVILAHVGFFCSQPIVSSVSEDGIFRDVLFPFLLYTKSKRVTVASVWKTLVESKVAKTASGILAGLEQAHGDFASTEEIAVAAAKNSAIAAALARKTFDFLGALRTSLILPFYHSRKHRSICKDRRIRGIPCISNRLCGSLLASSRSVYLEGAPASSEAGATGSTCFGHYRQNRSFRLHAESCNRTRRR